HGISSGADISIGFRYAKNQCLPPDRQQAMPSSEMPGPEFHDFSYVGKFFSNFGRQILEKDGERKLNNMKTKIISKMFLSLGLVFVLVGAITQVHGDSPAIPIVTINSTGDVPRGKTGSFVLHMKPAIMLGGAYVNFSVSGTAVPGVDYVSLVSPTYV